MEIILCLYYSGKEKKVNKNTALKKGLKAKIRLFNFLQNRLSFHFLSFHIFFAPLNLLRMKKFWLKAFPEHDLRDLHEQEGWSSVGG